MWILGVSALLGNGFVITRRLITDSRQSSKKRIGRVQNIMVANLALADSLMGVYMLIIASVDVLYRDRYAFYAEQWQTSIVCKLAGILSVLSSEASVLFMTAISVDRCVGCLFPFSPLKLNVKSAKIVAGIVWSIILILSLIPLMIPGYFGDAFYGRSSVCLALPLTTDRPQGWQYSVALFLFLNLVAFMVMIGCYMAIYFTAKSSSLLSGRDRNSVRAKELELALRMAFLVFSDMCCWMPIIIMGIVSLTTNIEIPAVSYAWIAVFVLPLNSSLNPYLYTILTREMSKREAAKRREAMLSESQFSNATYSRPSVDDGKSLKFTSR